MQRSLERTGPRCGPVRVLALDARVPEMLSAFFVSDLHGRVSRYESLFGAIERERPRAVFLGGDLLPHGLQGDFDSFVVDYLAVRFSALREALDADYPRIFAIFGNDDPRIHEVEFRRGEDEGLWEYIHGKRAIVGAYAVVGYSYVPPTPFRLKDWERYDVGRFVDPGCVSPEDGVRTIAVPESETRYATIARDLGELTMGLDAASLVMLVHTPPHSTKLDRAALDGVVVDHAPVDLHVGSIAVRRHIESVQPRLTMHGHIHESARLTGSWRDRIGVTEMLSAAHDGPELALVRIDLDEPARASRELIEATEPP